MRLMGGLNKTALTLRDAKLLIKYLDGVDDAISIRLQEGFRPDEPYLTMLLCEMLDQNNTSRHVLEYPFIALKAELQSDPKVVNANLSIETIKYPAHLESKVTFSDFGVVVSYHDNVFPEHSFAKGALFQAKKLYFDSELRYSMRSEFEAFDFEQLAKLAYLSLNIPGAPHYLFFCPKLSAYDESSRAMLHRMVIPSDDIFDYSMGWHKQEFADDPNRHIPGLVVSDLEWLTDKYLEEELDGGFSVRTRNPLPTVQDVYCRYWNGTSAFSWFLVYDMLMGQCGSEDPLALFLANGRMNRDDAPFLPRFVIRLSISVGPPQAVNEPRRG